MLGVGRGGGGEQEAQKGVRSGNVSMIILICPFDNNMVSPFIASLRKKLSATYLLLLMFT